MMSKRKNTAEAPQKVKTPDGEGVVNYILWPRVSVLFPNGTVKVYDVDDCLFPG